MSRDLTTDTIAAITSSVVALEYLYEGVFSSNTLRLWSGIGPLSWSGKVFEGNGWMQGPGSVTESTSVRSTGATITLSGAISDLLSIALNESRQSSTGKLWLASLDSSGNVIQAILLFSGNLDTVEISEDVPTSEITLNYESRLIMLNAPREQRYTHEEQQVDHKGDLGFEHVASLPNQRLYWGRPDPGRPK